MVSVERRAAQQWAKALALLGLRAAWVLAAASALEWPVSAKEAGPWEPREASVMQAAAQATQNHGRRRRARTEDWKEG